MADFYTELGAVDGCLHCLRWLFDQDSTHTFTVDDIDINHFHLYSSGHQLATVQVGLLVGTGKLRVACRTGTRSKLGHSAGEHHIELLPDGTVCDADWLAAINMIFKTLGKLEALA